MKIGVNSRLYQNNKTGIPYYIEQLYKNLLEIDKKNKYIFFQTDARRTLGKTRVANMPFLKFLQAPLFDIFLVNLLIKKEKIDIYHSPSFILPFKKFKNVKYIVTIHDLSFLILPEYQSKSFYYYFKFLVGISIKNADIIIADSVNTANDIIKFYKIKRDKINVVYPGINKVFFSVKIAFL